LASPCPRRALHLLAGLLVIPLAHLLVLRRILPDGTRWWVAGPVLGLAVWAVAVGGIGNLGTGAVFPAAGPRGLLVLAAHLAMGGAIAAVADRRRSRHPPGGRPNA